MARKGPDILKKMYGKNQKNMCREITKKYRRNIERARSTTTYVWILWIVPQVLQNMSEKEKKNYRRYKKGKEIIQKMYVKVLCRRSVVRRNLREIFIPKYFHLFCEISRTLQTFSKFRVAK
jgi:hypothetical protein